MDPEGWQDYWGEMDFVHELGPVVFWCRPRLRKDAWEALGGAGILIHVSALLGALYLTIPLVGLAMYWEVPPPLMAHPIWGPVLGISYAGCAALIYFYHITAPRGPALVLHEDGFRYGRKAVPFAELRSIAIGQVNAPVMKGIMGLNRAVGRFSVQNRAAAMLGAGFRGGVRPGRIPGRPALSLKNVRATYLQGDIDWFFEAIASRHPELLEPGSAGLRLTEVPSIRGERATIPEAGRAIGAIRCAGPAPAGQEKAGHTSPDGIVRRGSPNRRIHAPSSRSGFRVLSSRDSSPSHFALSAEIGSPTHS